MKRKNGLLAFCLSVLILVPLLYAASSGPALWLGSRGYISFGSDAPARRIYRPITWLAERSPMFSRVWVHFWLMEETEDSN